MRTRTDRFPSAATAGLAQAVRPVLRPLAEDRELDPLLERIGEARCVLLGEASHGTSEYYTWRTAITRRLVEEKGVLVLVDALARLDGEWQLHVVGSGPLRSEAERRLASRPESVPHQPVAGRDPGHVQARNRLAEARVDGVDEGVGDQRVPGPGGVDAIEAEEAGAHARREAEPRPGEGWLAQDEGVDRVGEPVLFIGARDVAREPLDVGAGVAHGDSHAGSLGFANFHNTKSSGSRLISATSTRAPLSN